MAENTPEWCIYGSCYTLTVASCFLLEKNVLSVVSFEELVTSGDHL